MALTSFVEESRVVAAIEAGASGYLLKDADADDLAAAIRAAASGEVHLDPAVAGIVARRMRERSGTAPGADASGDGAASTGWKGRPSAAPMRWASMSSGSESTTGPGRPEVAVMNAR